MMKKHDFSLKPRLEGQRLMLRPFEESDIDMLLAILEEVEVNRLTGSVTNSQAAKQPMSAEAKQKTIEWYRTRNQQVDRLDLAIYSKKINEVVGEVVINDWDEASNSANYRILIGEKGRNQGLGSEATQLIIAHAFDYLGLNRLELEVFSFNPRARHVYEKSGFIFEGCKRQALKFDDQYIDSEFFAILASDYRKLKGTR